MSQGSPELSWVWAASYLEAPKGFLGFVDDKYAGDLDDNHAPPVHQRRPLRQSAFKESAQATRSLHPVGARNLDYTPQADHSYVPLTTINP